MNTRSRIGPADSTYFAVHAAATKPHTDTGHPGLRNVVATENLAQLLNGLYANWESQHGVHLTNQRVASALTNQGCPVSIPYLSQLRHGRRTRPSITMIAALAAFFEVSKEYFDHRPVTCEATDADLVERLANTRLRRLATSAVGLSEESMDYLSVMADKLRLAESLPVDPCVAT
ncbi:hypothetical protein [Nocardia brasiliensis]|uniref:hypothetical protein n=1 Tax=Nocardia brasiliensis TaxID=37326 RepID=UPI003D91003F